MIDRLTAMQAFVRTVELGSFTAAAAELRVTQSTVSKWVAALEELLGVRLLDRTTRQVHATEAGEELLQRARDILATYDQAVADLAERGAALRGPIRISMPVVFGAMFLTEAISSFARQHPLVEVQMLFSDRYVNLVEERVDVAVRVGVPEDSAAIARTLGGTPRRLVAAPGYLEARGAPGHPRDLADHACLLHTGLSTGAVWSFRRGKELRRAPVRGKLAANHSEALLRLAVAGHGVALLADWLVRAEVDRGALRVLLPEWRARPAPIQALRPPGRPHPRVAALIDHLEAHLSTRLG